MTDASDTSPPVRTRLRRAADTSFLTRTNERIGRTLTRWSRGSRLVQWLFTEPEPDVVVIDLGETYTVGPFVRALDRTLDVAGRVADRTGLSEAVQRVVRRVESEPVRMAGGLLAVVTLAGIALTLVSGGTVGGWLLALGVALLATRDRRSTSELAETRVGRAVRVAFERPDNPEFDD